MSSPIPRTFPGAHDILQPAACAPSPQLIHHGMVSAPIPLYPTGTAALVPAPPTYEVIPNRIFVGGFPSSTTEGELREHFEKFHPVKDVKMVKSLDGASKGYGFVTFENEDQAEEVRQLNPKELEFRGRKLNLGPAIRKTSSSPYTSGYAIAQTQLVPASPTPYGLSFSPAGPPHMFLFPPNPVIDQSQTSPLSTPTVQTQFYITSDATPARSYANAVAGGENVAPQQNAEVPKSQASDTPATHQQNVQNHVAQQYVHQPPPPQQQHQQQTQQHQQPQQQLQQAFVQVPQQNQFHQTQVVQNSFDPQQSQHHDAQNVQHLPVFNYGHPINFGQVPEGDRNGMGPNGYMPNPCYYQNGGVYSNYTYPGMPYQYSGYPYYPQIQYPYGVQRFNHPNQNANGYHHNQPYSDGVPHNQMPNGHQNQQQSGYQYPTVPAYAGSDAPVDYGNSRSPHQSQNRGRTSSNNINTRKNRYSESRDENMKGTKASSPLKGTRGDKRAWGNDVVATDSPQKGKSSKGRGQLSSLTNKLGSLSISSPNKNSSKN